MRAGSVCSIGHIGPPRPSDGSSALQEEFDARLYPAGWDLPGFIPTATGCRRCRWRVRRITPSTSSYSGGDTMDSLAPPRSSLRLRQIPPLREDDCAGRNGSPTPAACTGFAIRTTGSSTGCRAHRIAREAVASPWRADKYRGWSSCPPRKPGAARSLLRVRRADRGLAACDDRCAGGDGRRADDPGVTRSQGAGVARHAFLRLDAVRLPRRGQPARTVRVRLAPLDAVARRNAARPVVIRERGGSAADVPLASAP